MAILPESVRSLTLGRLTPRASSLRATWSDAGGQQQRWSEGQDGSHDRGDGRPHNGRVQKPAGRAEGRIGSGPGEVAPHPRNYGKVTEKHSHKTCPQRVGRPRVGAADGVQRIQNDQRAAPDAKAARKPPQAARRIRAEASSDCRRSWPDRQNADQCGQRQDQDQRDDTRRQRVVEPEPRQAQIQRTPGRNETAAQAQQVADEKEQADAGMHSDIGQQRGGGRAERMLARMRASPLDHRHDRGNGREQRQHRKSRSSPSCRRRQGPAAIGGPPPRRRRAP